MADDLHELSAAYALDALTDDERARFERHLDDCPRCRDELRSLRNTAAALGFAVEGPAPPEALRGSILAAARAERPNVVPLRPRRQPALYVAAAVAVAATAAAVVLGIWAASLHDSLASERAAVRLLGDPHARHVSTTGASGTLVVAPSGKAALAVALPAPPKGKTYEAWVIDNGVHRDRLFDGGTTTLQHRLSRGAVVKVTLERSGGVDAPTTQPLLSATV
jgi:anti-sigma factor RsiW